VTVDARTCCCVGGLGGTNDECGCLSHPSSVASAPPECHRLRVQ
jgi:hypothetical protein